MDKSSVVPIYHQLKTLLQGRILSGQYPVGSQLPSERELCEAYGISRMTVRQAIIDLVNEGLLQRERGRGTYVAKPKIQQGLQLAGFTEEMQRRNLLPGTRLLSLQTVSAAGKPAARLQAAEGEPLHRIIRLRLADDEPMALETSHIPAACLPDLTAASLASGSLYALLCDCGLQPAYADQAVEAAQARTDEAKLLDIRIKAPVLLIERTTFLRDDRPVEFVQSVYRGDRYTFSFRLTQPH